MKRTILLAGILALSGCGGGGSSSPGPTASIPPPATPTIADVTAYLATSRCADGMPAVLESGCAAAPQNAADPMLFRRADMSGHADGQIEDAFAGVSGNYFVNSFSYPPHGAFVAGDGDGGDVLVSDGATVRIDYTQNGAPNGGTVAGYWAGPGCPGGTGWLLFNNTAPTGSWESAEAELAAAPAPGACPALNPAYTQWRLENAAVPFTLPGGAVQSVTLPIVVSEHYAGPSLAVSAAMERFIMARGVGRVVWEAWGTTPNAASFACPGIAPWNAAPAAGWYLEDRRCLTDVVAGNGVTGDQFGWPPAGFAP